MDWVDRDQPWGLIRTTTLTREEDSKGVVHMRNGSGSATYAGGGGVAWQVSRQRSCMDGGKQATVELHST